MNIQAFDKQNLNAVRKDIDAALAEVAAKYNINLKAGAARYSNNDVTFKLEGTVKNEAGEVVTKGARALKAYYPQYVGKKVTLSGGKKGTVIEYHSRKRKYPFIVEVATARGTTNYKVSEYSIR